MIYTENCNNDWTNEWTKEYVNEWTNECTKECNDWDHWVEDIENCEFPDQYIMIDAKIICVNNILNKHHILKFQENKKEKVKERQIILTDVQLEQINKKKRDQAKRDFEIDEWTRTQLYNDCYFIDIEGGEGEEVDIECIKKKEVFEYFNEIIQTSYLFITAIRYL